MNRWAKVDASAKEPRKGPAATGRRGRRSPGIDLVFLSHSAGTSGAERGLLELALGLMKAGYRLCVLVPRHGPLLDLLDEVGLPWRVVPYKRWATRKRRRGRRARALIRQIAPVRRLIKLFREMRPAVVITNTVTTPAGAVAARLLGIAHIWYIREFGVEDHGFRFDLGLPMSARLIGHLSNRVILNCAALRDYHSRWVRENKLQVIYNAVELGVSDIQLEAWRSQRPPGDLGLRCALVGRIAPVKGQEDALRAFGLLKQRGVQAHLSLVGAGEGTVVRALRSLCEQLEIADRVDFLGFSNQPLRHFCQADVALVCSRFEAFGRVTVEAMKVGLPVIGSDVGGNREHIRHEWNGLLYPPAAWRLLADNIERLARDPGLRDRLAHNARRGSRAFYCMDRQVAEMVALLEEIARLSPRNANSLS